VGLKKEADRILKLLSTGAVDGWSSDKRNTLLFPEIL